MRARLVIVGLLAAACVFAQGRGGGGGSRNRGGGEAPMGGFAKSRLEMMGDMLKLSRDQKRDVKSIMDDAQKEASPIKDELAKSRAQVASAIGSGKQDEIDKAVAAHSAVEAKMTGVEMKAFAGIYKLLDPDQRNRTRSLFMMMPGVFKGKNWLDMTE